jgi:hypothetical protein
MEWFLSFTKMSHLVPLILMSKWNWWVDGWMDGWMDGQSTHMQVISKIAVTNIKINFT